MLRYIFLIVIVFVFTGCALTEDKIDIPYQGRANITVVQGADKVNVEVKNEDKRTVFKDRVGAKKNGYGMEMAKIVPSNDVAKTFSDAVLFELENLGFKNGTGGKIVKVELIRFYNDFKMGFFAGDAVADGLVNIVVTNGKNEVIFSKSYEGGGVYPNIQLALGENAREALIKAMTDIIGKVAQDKDLHSALLKK
jgi:uncharacterized lipoprotein YajG